MPVTTALAVILLHGLRGAPRSRNQPAIRGELATEVELAEIRRRLSITRERVRQIEVKALAKLRAARHQGA